MVIKLFNYEKTVRETTSTIKIQLSFVPISFSVFV